MTCEHCCGAEKLFDDKGAKKQLKKYKRSGPKGATQRLIEQTFPEDNRGHSLLDIGGGIGAIQWAFLETHGETCTDVDASEAYLNTASKYGQMRGWSEQVSYLKGDFTDLAGGIEVHDYVTLDKVVCCYPDYRSLLTLAAGKCGKRLGFSFPLGGWIPKLLSKMAGVYFALKKNPFRSYIHSKNRIHDLMTDLGFKRVHRSIRFPMRVWVYEK